MKLGYLQIYNEIDWAAYHIDQDMLMCDKLLITEGSQFANFTHIPERSDDGTLDIIHDKIKEYPGRITLNETIRKHGGYRKNQCANFNRALEFCDVGDYFISLDADEFYFNEHINRLNNLMKEGKADVIGSYGLHFSFGFKWRIIINNNPVKGKRHILKKTKGLYFVPTHKPRNIGPNVVENKQYVGLAHYVWVKPAYRLRMRHETSGSKAGLLEWFDKNWDSVELKDGSTFKHLIGNFKLLRYEGNHPEILKNHPWKDIDDVRRI